MISILVDKVEDKITFVAICSSFVKWRNTCKYFIYEVFKNNNLVFVFRVSDQVLEDCLKEVADELEDINEVFVNQVCKSEFMINSTLNSTQTSPGFTPGGSLHHSPSHSTGGHTPVASPEGAAKMVAFSEKDDLVSASQEEPTISDEMTVEGDEIEDEDSEEYEDDYEDDDYEDDEDWLCYLF